ncbi:MAG: hypothetical protein AMXMBFR59_42780 [Rhodanobacteraceae bacterium]
MHYQNFPARHVGHKGLFVDRMDSRIERDTGGQLQDPPRLIPFAHDVCHAGNRAYLPQLGRWLQPDPNATAQTLLMGAVHGQELEAVVAAFDFDTLFGDGANLYEYLGSNPWLRYDPTGLAWDPFSAVDEYIAEDSASKAAFMERLSRGFNAAAHIALQIAQLHPALNIIISGAKLASGEYTLEEVLVSAATGFLMGKVVAQAVGAYHKIKALKRSAQAMQGVSRMYEHVYKVGSYAKMKQLTRGFKHEIQAHHILEVKHARRWNLDSEELPAVVLTREEHSALTLVLEARWRQVPDPTRAQVMQVYEQVYSHRPEWLAAIRQYLQ